MESGQWRQSVGFGSRKRGDKAKMKAVVYGSHEHLTFREPVTWSTDNWQPVAAGPAATFKSRPCCLQGWSQPIARHGRELGTAHLCLEWNSSTGQSLARIFTGLFETFSVLQPIWGSSYLPFLSFQKLDTNCCLKAGFLLPDSAPFLYIFLRCYPPPQQIHFCLVSASQRTQTGWEGDGMNFLVLLPARSH
jgi:hypothetical protein